MRPLQLKLNYFGPYRQQKIDFTKFDRTSMFLISGPTGAGKSTIFDGLVFALYDKASGSQRDPKEFRSDFATIHDETSVELTFTHRGHYYQIIRKPKQTLAKKRGQGTTEQSPQIELTIYADETPTQEIKQLTKIDQANKYLADLLQLNAAQFRQIVLLPQGEFRQFLNGDSNQKEAVLRNLFQTQRYEQWVKQLQTQYKQLKDDNGQRQQKIQTLLQQVNWLPTLAPDDQVSVTEQLDLLQQQTDQMKTKESEQQAQAAQLKEELEQQQAELTQRQYIKTLFEQQQEAQNTLATLQQQTPQITQMQQQLDQLKWAQDNHQHYQSLQQVTTEFTQAKAQLATAKDSAQIIKQQQALLQQTAAELQTHEKEQQELQTQLIQYADLFPKYQQVTKLQQAKQQLAKEITQQQQQHQQTDEQLQTVQQQIKELGELQEQTAYLYLQQRQLDQSADQLKKLQELVNQATDFYQQISVINKELTTQQQHVQVTIERQSKIQTDYRQVKSNYASQQIAILQRDLLPNEPCPVCGSRDHSQIKLVQNDAPIVSEELLDEMDQQRQAVEKEVATLESSITTLQNSSQQLQQKYEDTWQQIVQQTADTNMATLDEVKQFLTLNLKERDKEQTKLSQKQAEITAQQQKLTEYKEQSQQLTVKSQALQVQINDQQRQLAIVETQFQDLQQQLPTEFTSSAELTDFLTSTKQRVAEFKKQQMTLQQQLQQNQQQQAENKTDQRHYQQQIETDQIKLEQLQTEMTTIFNQNWPTLSFKAQCEQYERILTQLDQQADLVAQIEQYQQQIVSQQAVLQRLKQQLKDYQEIPDLKQPQQQIQQIQSEQSTVQEQVGQLKNQISQQIKITENVKELMSDIVDITPLQELSELARGNGSQKLGLERYVLQTYLTQVLLVANQRLAKLTRGRYRLALAEELGSARKNSGLELNVFDDYVGDYRSVRTLSGGESFIAALALALALGEVVQQQTGAIEINTLFIDEGFGSLDEEALNTAIEALMSLESQQRMIGIISHVRELQTQIPAQLKVISHGNGESSIQYQVDEN